MDMLLDFITNLVARYDACVFQCMLLSCCFQNLTADCPFDFVFLLRLRLLLDLLLEVSPGGYLVCLLNVLADFQPSGVSHFACSFVVPILKASAAASPRALAERTVRCPGVDVLHLLLICF